MEERTYTIDQIKKAFWEVFHESGEQWFNRLGAPEENEESTAGVWSWFIETLKEMTHETR